MDNPGIAFGSTARLDVLGILQSHLFGGMALVSTCAVHIELGWSLCILALHYNFLGSLTHIECLLESQVETLAVNRDAAVTTHIDNAQLTVVEQAAPVITLREVHIEGCDGGKRQRRRSGHGTTHEETVDRGIGPVHLAGHHHFFDEKLATKAAGVVAHGILGVGRIAHTVVRIAVLCLHFIAVPSALGAQGERPCQKGGRQ